MFSNTKHWGEIDDKTDDQYVYLPKVDFSPLIDSALSQPGWSPQRLQGAIVGLPLDSVTLRAAFLAEHARQLDGRAECKPANMEGMSGGGGESSGFMNARIESVLSQPASHPLQHEAKPPLGFIEKEYCAWSRGSAPPSLGRATSADCRRALQQAAALELATRPASLGATRSVLEAMADAADQFLRQFTGTMRTIADREAADKPSGFPDLVSKTLCELGIFGIHEWYNDNVLGACQRALHRIKVAEPISVHEEVPELHFPASLEALGEGSLGPGYRMLHSLENADLMPRLPMHLELMDDTSPITTGGNT